MSRASVRPWLLRAPALVLFCALLLTPLLMTFLLSFNSFDFYGGIKIFKRLIIFLFSGKRIAAVHKCTNIFRIKHYG